MKEWKNIQCHNCSGHGLVSAYSFDGRDFEGPDECGTCNGTGQLSVSPKGALAQYPGGPFVGHLTKLEVT